MKFDQIKLSRISPDDLQVMASACEAYAQVLESLYEQEGRTQQYIHYSILENFRMELFRKLTNRKRVNRHTLTMELFTAFVLHDSLQYFLRVAPNSYSSAVLNRINFALYRELPRTSDTETLSVMSSLNMDDY